MGIRILYGDYDGGPQERAALIDSTTDRPLPLPMFESATEAEDFCQWHQQKYGDARRCDVLELDAHHTEWLAQRCEGCGTVGCGCVDCGRPCTVPCAPECRQ